MRPDADKHVPDREPRRLSIINGRPGVPAELVHALRATAVGDCQPVWVPMPGRPDMLITVAAGLEDTDPARVWRFLRAPHIGSDRVGPYRIAHMPWPLISYVFALRIVLSSRLSGDDVAAAGRVTRRGWGARYPGGLLSGVVPPIAAAAARLRAVHAAASQPEAVGAAVSGVTALLVTVAAVLAGPPPQPELHVRSGQPPPVGVQAPAGPGEARDGIDAARARPAPCQPSAAPHGHAWRAPPRRLPCRRRPYRLLPDVIRRPVAAVAAVHPVRAAVGQQQVRATLGDGAVASWMDAARQAWTDSTAAGGSWSRPDADRPRVRDSFGGPRGSWGDR